MGQIKIECQTSFIKQIKEGIIIVSSSRSKQLIERLDSHHFLGLNLTFLGKLGIGRPRLFQVLSSMQKEEKIFKKYEAKFDERGRCANKRAYKGTIIEPCVSLFQKDFHLQTFQLAWNHSLVY